MVAVKNIIRIAGHKDDGQFVIKGSDVPGSFHAVYSFHFHIQKKQVHFARVFLKP